MTRAEQLCAFTEKHRDLILAAEEYIWKNPESGYREWKTTAYMEKVFEDLGYELHRAGNIPGFYADLDTGRPGPKIAILGELDSLIIPSHPECDPETGAVHACGHHAQCATLVGVAAAFKEPGALDGLCGSFRFIAVPAEELIEIGFRESLRKQGIIRFFGGKVEFIYRGYFRGVDMAMMIHSGKLAPGKVLEVNKGNNGCIAKNVVFKGVAAHAGGAPHKGVNALYIASMAMNAVNALRETFIDDEHIRFHPILTESGTAVNTIPDRVVLESYVRGATHEGIARSNEKINRALAGAALSIGGGVELCDRPGYFPLNNNPAMARIMGQAAELACGEGSFESVLDQWDTGCTDMGDVSAIMPACHGTATGVSGMGHGIDYKIADKYAATVVPAKCLVLTADLLLRDDAAKAKEIIANTVNVFASQDDYLAALDHFDLDRDAVQYNEDGTVTVNYR